jgi:putative ABC transport system permease protein
MGPRHWLGQFLRDLSRQRLRAALTLFGLIWGTTAVILLMAFGEGLEGRLVKNVRGLGENIVIGWAAQTSRPWQGLPRNRRITVKAEDIEAIRRDVPEVTAISGEHGAGNRKFRVGHKVIVPDLSASNPVFAAMRNLIPQEGGRFVNELDMDERRRVVFIGDGLAADLFGTQDVVGRTVMIDNVPFLVVGVMQAKEQDSSYSGRDKDRASMPETTFRAVYGQQPYNNFVFQIADVSRVEATKDSVIASMARRHRFDPADHEAIRMWDVTENEKFLKDLMLGFRLFIGIVGALTLVVAGIGVSNIMHVVVEERTREIGIKMALGAHQRAITGQLLFETMLLTAMGGCIGFAISWGICAVFPASLDKFVGTPAISFQVAAVTTLALGLIGLTSGYFPARAAARLNPVEALRM